MIHPLQDRRFRFRTAFLRAASLAALLAFAVPAAHATDPEPVAEPGRIGSVLARIGSFTDRATSLALEAMSLIGIHYRRGGSTPEHGLDCSGLVRYVFRQANGTELPRTSAEISQMGEKIEKKDLQPGDLVFFNTLKRTFSHVGIYLGDNKFIHAPSSGGAVRIDSMDLDYWKARFNGARRILGGSEPQEAPKR